MMTFKCLSLSKSNSIYSAIEITEAAFLWYLLLGSQISDVFIQNKKKKPPA